jgi:hypothetical protein
MRLSEAYPVAVKERATADRTEGPCRRIVEENESLGMWLTFMVPRTATRCTDSSPIGSCVPTGLSECAEAHSPAAPT